MVYSLKLLLCVALISDKIGISSNGLTANHPHPHSASTEKVFLLNNIPYHRDWAQCLFIPE